MWPYLKVVEVSDLRIGDTLVTLSWPGSIIATEPIRMLSAPKPGLVSVNGIRELRKKETIIRLARKDEVTDGRHAGSNASPGGDIAGKDPAT